MALFLQEETLEYAIGDTVFLYERLCRADMGKIQYLCAVRGQFDAQLYETVCVAVALKGWRNLYGTNGLLAYPCRMPARAVTSIDPEQLAALEALYPQLSQAEREGLHGRLYVVEHMPMDIFYDLLPKVRELDPAELKKKWLGSLNGTLPSPIPPPATSTPAMTVVPSAEPVSSLPVTLEDSPPAGAGS